MTRHEQLIHRTQVRPSSLVTLGHAAAERVRHSYTLCLHTDINSVMGPLFALPCSHHLAPFDIVCIVCMLAASVVAAPF